MYILFIHTENGLLYGGIFSKKEKVEAVKNRWNNENEDDSCFADYINVTDEIDNEFILGVDFRKEEN